MAYLFKKPKVKKSNLNKTIAQKYVYNTPTWKSLRLVKLKNNPLCEECLKTDRVEAATEVHHIIEFMNGTTIEQIKFYGFDYNNLMSLCLKCHQNKHK